jgi:site-specific DNA-methyltransferase (cytosine-N4-specific)
MLVSMVKRTKSWKRKGRTQSAYRTRYGEAFQSSVEDFCKSPHAKMLRGQVQLILTSPPFPLASPKKYGNQTGDQYRKWLEEIVVGLIPLLRPSGSLVIEIGNAWDRGTPTMSTIPLETLISIHRQSGLHICQQFIANNPNRLPSPVNYVNRERARVKDSYTHIWWFGLRVRPFASNRSVLKEYSPSMKRLLRTGKYNSGSRPSQHQIGDRSFLKDNGGAIPSNLLEFSGSESDPKYRAWCKKIGVRQHPARMASGIAEFFISFLTKPSDLVLDPFAGSNTIGAVAERLSRRWLAVERDHDYLRGSIGRFD